MLLTGWHIEYRGWAEKQERNQSQGAGNTCKRWCLSSVWWLEARWGWKTKVQKGDSSIPTFLTPTRNLMNSVLAFCNCHNKLPHFWWLKTTVTHSLRVLDARSLTSRYQQGQPPSKGSRGESFLASPNLAYGNRTPISASIFTRPFLLSLLFWLL